MKVRQAPWACGGHVGCARRKPEPPPLLSSPRGLAFCSVSRGPGDRSSLSLSSASPTQSYRAPPPPAPPPRPSPVTDSRQGLHRRGASPHERVTAGQSARRKVRGPAPVAQPGQARLSGGGRGLKGLGRWRCAGHRGRRPRLRDSTPPGAGRGPREAGRVKAVGAGGCGECE